MKNEANKLVHHDEKSVSTKKREREIDALDTVDRIHQAKKGRDITLRDDEEYMERLRLEARQQYLIQREEDRLELERRHLEELETALNEGVLDYQTAQLLEEQRETYRVASEAIKDRKTHARLNSELYHMPEAYNDDIEDKLEVLKNRATSHRNPEDEEFIWEDDKLGDMQLKRAGLNHDLEKVNISDLRMMQEGLDTEDKKEFKLMTENNELIDFKVVYGQTRKTNEQEEEELLLSLTEEERVEYLWNKGKGFRQKMETERKLLPIYGFKKDLVDAIKRFKILIVVGETGSGKTTQLPQYLLEEGYGKICCSQPRRVAAQSVAQRVSQENGTRLGRDIGYKIRFDDKTTPNLTKLVYMTDGMLLKELLGEPDMSSYNVLMIDEAHERTLATDVLFGLVKDIVRSRDDFRLIVCSATLDSKKFSEFFDHAPIFTIPGRKFPVDHYYSVEPEANYLDASAVTAMQIHLGCPLDGDILIFLPGQKEIEEVQNALTLRMEEFERLEKQVAPLLVLPCYSSLPQDKIQLIFEPTPKGHRKIVLATNVAETSITIDNIVYVIDPGFVKQTNHNPRTGMSSLVSVPISKASADQRSGRAGRVKPGKCFRLYTQWSFNNEMEVSNDPEIQRSDVGSVVLLLKSLGIDDVINFDFLDPPQSHSVMSALETLYGLGGLNEKGQLTQLGRRMAELPLNAVHAKMLLSGGVNYGVVREIIIIIAMLSVGSGTIFHVPPDKRQVAETVLKSLYHRSGDHLSLLNIFTRWEENNFSRQWCMNHYIQEKAMNRAREIKDQLEDQLVQMAIDLTSNSTDDLRIRKALSSGGFRNVARLNRNGQYTTIKHPHQVAIHPSSALFNEDHVPDR